MMEMAADLRTIGDVEIDDGRLIPGVHLDNKLDWKGNTEADYRKGQSRLCFEVFYCRAERW